MRHSTIVSLLALPTLALVPLSTFASGPSGETGNTPGQQSRGRFERIESSRSPSNRSQNALPQISIVRAPYEMGKALLSGKYQLGNPQLQQANIVEKRQRLDLLQTVLPRRQQEQANLPALAPRLTDREMNALEYYIAVRFGKSMTPPSWAGREPPPKVQYRG